MKPAGAGRSSEAQVQQWQSSCTSHIKTSVLIWVFRCQMPKPDLCTNRCAEDAHPRMTHLVQRQSLQVAQIPPLTRVSFHLLQKDTGSSHELIRYLTLSQRKLNTRSTPWHLVRNAKLTTKEDTNVSTSLQKASASLKHRSVTQ